ncbi:hypothetical protein [Sphingomonas sp.]|uniref:hypothetical protein n=1 Tax=Sphingomonas sp. TaxID=28214 RepID=UPI003CC5AFDA
MPPLFENVWVRLALIPCATLACMSLLSQVRSKTLVWKTASADQGISGQALNRFVQLSLVGACTPAQEAAYRSLLEADSQAG